MEIDAERLQAHLDVLLEEVRELRCHLDAVAEQQREAAHQELLDAFAPALEALVRVEAEATDARRVRLVDELLRAFEAIGLERVGTPREELELWPEQAKRRLALDGEVPEDATLVRAEVLAPGWARGEAVLALPLGRIIEVCR